jgi:MerR family transcriptional regulator, light-induced transcriptional regulator
LAGRYKIKTVAERIGFSPTLLRAWERRYSFLLPERQASGHRLYTEDDMKVLKSVKLLLDRGQSIGEVAALGRDALLLFDLGPTLHKLPQVVTPALDNGLSEMKDSLLQAIQLLEANAVRRMFHKMFADLEFETVSRFVLEVSREVGNLWATGHMSVASEHLLSAVLKEQIQLLTQDYLQKPTGDKTVICAGFPDELHELGLLFLNHELARARHKVVYLGPALPLEDLDAAVSRLQPHVVCLSVSRTPVLRVHLPRFAETIARHSSPVFVVGGDGVSGMEKELAQVGAVPWSSGSSLRAAAEKLFL